jgi:hypothetical protein
MSVAVIEIPYMYGISMVAVLSVCFLECECGVRLWTRQNRVSSAFLSKSMEYSLVSLLLLLLNVDARELMLDALDFGGGGSRSPCWWR